MLFKTEVTSKWPEMTLTETVRCNQDSPHDTEQSGCSLKPILTFKLNPFLSHSLPEILTAALHTPASSIPVLALLHVYASNFFSFLNLKMGD